ncbi:sensor histidine kinase [Methylotenera mobilis]|uniref:Histidine kinase internal region n=1 Tax=Methylotenera mobilis (strain JLW8 / ATCC BAA-1282 / DSM 17540) TaxID=583345 RepID=C6WYV4_METML|nr:histidine kinase [Methylotenera mobilis]ACT47079.1 histidine kinase internal region [Methylotenera mobilis JLW8]
MKNTSRLPNLRNLGVALRILIIANLALILGAFILTDGINAFMDQLTGTSAFAQPILLISLFLLYSAYHPLSKMPYRRAILSILILIALSATAVHAFFSQFWIFTELPSLTRMVLYAWMISAPTLYYFNLHHRAYSPAVTEARLQALQARIRPHFLFNSLNAVLSLIRDQPKQAETALEDMADLFRVLMGENRELVPITQEISLCRQYLALEKLRLDERLHVEWLIDDVPPDILIPPLLLQPLIENAVYHGIEPSASGGTITIQIYTKQNEVHLLLKNPYTLRGKHHSGNNMALKNIKERLTLHFDLEASLKSKQVGDTYQVHITLPSQQQKSYA